MESTSVAKIYSRYQILLNEMESALYEGADSESIRLMVRELFEMPDLAKDTEIFVQAITVFWKLHNAISLDHPIADRLFPMQAVIGLKLILAGHEDGEVATSSLYMGISLAKENGLDYVRLRRRAMHEMSSWKERSLREFFKETRRYAFEIALPDAAHEGVFHFLAQWGEDPESPLHEEAIETIIEIFEKRTEEDSLGCMIPALAQYIEVVGLNSKNSFRIKRILQKVA